jgi:hypothetical protein
MCAVQGGGGLVWTMAMTARSRLEFRVSRGGSGEELQ